MHDNHCDGRTPNARFWEKVDSMAGEGPSFSKSAKIPEVNVSTPIGPETVSKPAKPTLPEPLERGGDGSPISYKFVSEKRLKRGHGVTMCIKIHRRTLVGCLPFGLILNLTSFRRRNKVVKPDLEISAVSRVSVNSPRESGTVS
uniref:Uncharacterized protein n=1 Tax=Brassica campestris TaxID=3711 RepID=A0A3P6ADP6_BRACM|nr:unnamed protein product [Brassica rapa]